MYAFASMANNNGSAFAGLGSAATWYQVTGGIVMLLGRFAPEIFILGLAGSLARQAPVPQSAGTLDTRTPLFVGMLVGVILILVGLTYFPALALGTVRRRTALMSVTTESPGTPAPSSGQAGQAASRAGSAAACSTRRCCGSRRRTRSRSWTRGSRSRTRSCSWSRSAPC